MSYINRRNRFFLVLVFFLCIGSVEVKADPRQILNSVIQQLQTGTPNPNWYGPQLWSTIFNQTGGSGVYPQLTSLGAVQNINIVASQALPQGDIFNMVAQHQNGQSIWFIGIGRFSNRIEYANFNIGATLPSNPIPNPTPNPTPTPSQPSTPDGAACQLYPDLC
jgi:hypothetical protein